MGILWLLGFILFGLVVGAVARLLMPGRQNLGCMMTAVLGMVGSAVGGTLWYFLFPDGQFAVRLSGFVVSTLGAILTLWIYEKATK